MPHLPVLLHSLGNYNFESVYSADVDIYHDELYWTSRRRKKIFRAPLSGGYSDTFLWRNVEVPGPIVIDGRGQKLYWADSGTGFIEVADLKGPDRRVLIASNLTNVTSIALDIQTQ